MPSSYNKMRIPEYMTRIHVATGRASMVIALFITSQILNNSKHSCKKKLKIRYIRKPYIAKKLSDSVRFARDYIWYKMGL